MQDIRLVDTFRLHGKIEVMTGLHIGAGKDSLEIGGMDNPIIKNPATGEPYIPGSSLKGKLRSICEWRFNKVLPARDERRKAGDPCGCGAEDCPVCRVFGSSVSHTEEAREKAKSRGPTRLIMRDAQLSAESRAAYTDKNLPLVEEKSENSLNRITAEATPRPVERVVPGVCFDFELVYRVMDTGDQGDLDRRYFQDVVLTGLRLLEHDCLGGGGSRGSGKVRFVGLADKRGQPVSLPEA